MAYLDGYRIHPLLAYRVWQREVTLYRRIWPSTILSTVFDPLLYLAALGFGLGSYIADVEGVSYARFIAPGLVASAIMYGSAFEAAWNAYVRMFVERSYEAMMATPASLEDVVAGEVLWAATRATVMSVLVLGVIAALGLVSSWWVLLVPFVAVLGGAVFSLLGLAYTVRLKHMDQITFLFTLGVTPMFLFSGVFFPLAGLPVWVQTVAWFSPLYHVVELTRGLAAGAPGLAALGHTAWLVVVVLLVWGLPTVTLRRRLTN